MLVLTYHFYQPKYLKESLLQRRWKEQRASLCSFTAARWYSEDGHACARSQASARVELNYSVLCVITFPKLRFQTTSRRVITQKTEEFTVMFILMVSPSISDDSSVSIVSSCHYNRGFLVQFPARERNSST
jgi:hypothetical protein